MSDSFSQIYIHIVFATKNRDKILTPEIREKVFKYISGIIEKRKCKNLAVNGYYDHVHILVGLNPNVSIAELVKEIKRSSTIFINTHDFIKTKFAWQEGYSSFSYSISQVDNVVKYIRNQEKHHSIKTFKEEYLDLLEKFSIETEKKKVFD